MVCVHLPVTMLTTEDNGVAKSVLVSKSIIIPKSTVAAKSNLVTTSRREYQRFEVWWRRFRRFRDGPVRALVVMRRLLSNRLTACYVVDDP